VQLHRFAVSGYRSLEDVEIHLGDVTVIVGPNGSGKTNLYRALRLAHGCGDGTLARMVAAEGGMDSIGYAGERRRYPRVLLELGLDGLDYEVELSVLGHGASFPLDPVIEREAIVVQGAVSGRVDLLRRIGVSAFLRDDEGNRVSFPANLHDSESVLTQVADPTRFGVLAAVRETLRRMRFHHQLRTDDDAPARRPSVATRTVAVSDDGDDLAAALATIQLEGNWRALDSAVAGALGGSDLLVEHLQDGRLTLGAEFAGFRRPLLASELSDGQLRVLHLAAVLLAVQPPLVTVLNEPETGLHPDLIGPLADLVVAGARSTQVILTTHSFELAHTLVDRGAVGIELSNRDLVTTTRVFGA
jgi:predicted ATPase